MEEEIRIYEDSIIPQSVLMAMPYKDYLKTLYWFEVKYEMMTTRGEQCEMCGVDFIWGNKHPWPEIHHKTYKNRGCEKLEDLELLCNICHRKKHAQDHYTRLEEIG